MKYKDFKKAVIAYMSANSMIKPKYIKKLIKLKKHKDKYTADFKYAGKSLNLERISDYWYLFTKETNEKTFIKNGTTINECCDFLWERRTIDSIQKNWYF